MSRFYEQEDWESCLAKKQTKRRYGRDTKKALLCPQPWTGFQTASLGLGAAPMPLGCI